MSKQMIASPRETNVALLKALGLEGRNIGKVQITFRLNDFPIVEIEEALGRDDFNNLIGEIRTMVLVPK